MSWIVKLFLFILFTLILNLFLNNIILSTLIVLIIGFIIIYNYNVRLEKKNQSDSTNKVIKCKYCKTEIDEEATVCPNCRRNQSIANHPLWLIPIIAIIGFFFYCFLSPNAPDSAREIFCSLGLRKGYPYCYKIDTEKLDNYLNNYNFDY